MPQLSYAMHDRMFGFLKGQSLGPPPASLRVALAQAEPRYENGAYIYNEPPTIGGYARQPLVLGDTLRANGVSTCKNNVPVVFNASALWPTVTHMLVFGEDGTLYFYGPLAAPRTAAVGDAIAFGNGTIQLRIK